MLTVSQVTKSFAGRVLFQDVSLQVNRGDRIGLVGPNGAGKSTLFALILGDVSPDKGTIAIEKNATSPYRAASSCNGTSRLRRNASASSRAASAPRGPGISAGMSRDYVPGVVYCDGSR